MNKSKDLFSISVFVNIFIFSTLSHADSFELTGYKFWKPHDWVLSAQHVNGDECFNLRNPKGSNREMNTFAVCSSTSNKSEFLDKAGFMENEAGNLVATGSFDVVNPILLKHASFNIVYAVTTCGMSDDAGFHAAGGTCFKAMAIDKKSNFYLFSEGISKDFGVFKKILCSIKKKK